MRIIQATLEHLDLLTPLFIEFRECHGQPTLPDSSRAFLEARLKNKEAVIYLALNDEDDGVLLGFCQLFPSFSSLSLKRLWMLNGIYVANHARRQLVADRLLQAAKQMAIKTQSVRIRAAAPPASDSAQRLYESIGFIKDEQFDNYILPLDND